MHRGVGVGQRGSISFFLCNYLFVTDYIADFCFRYLCLAGAVSSLHYAIICNRPESATARGLTCFPKVGFPEPFSQV